MPPTVAQYRALETTSAQFSEEPGGLVTLEISSGKAAARIFVQGAHVCEWTPSGAEPVLFVSKQSYFAPGKAIRGGVPVCYPWFAARAGHSGSPAHGFLRTTVWKVDSVRDEADGAVAVEFSAVDTEATRALWPNAFRATYSVRVSDSLELKLAIENTGKAPFSFEEALHTYFRVADVRSVTVTGLENTEHIDKVEGGSRKTRGTEPLTFAGETDSVFVNTAATCVLHDPGWNRRISVAKTGSATTVVWNPWTAKAAAMADFGDDEWPGMLCIETANAGENAVSLPAGQTHEMIATISVS
jgi:D-hexose-6-phosphate mutarotase